MNKRFFYLLSVIIHVIIVIICVQVGSIKLNSSSSNVVFVRVVSSSKGKGNRIKREGLGYFSKVPSATPKNSFKSYSKKAVKRRHLVKIVKKNRLFKRKLSDSGSKGIRKLIYDRRSVNGSEGRSSFSNLSGEKGSPKTTRGLSLPVVTKKVIPAYPYIARKRRYEGKVVLRALVDENGRVQKIVVVRSSGYPVLDKAAISALRRWRFIPAHISGRAVKIWVEIPFIFSLENY